MPEERGAVEASEAAASAASLAEAAKEALGEAAAAAVAWDAPAAAAVDEEAAAGEAAVGEAAGEAAEKEAEEALYGSVATPSEADEAAEPQLSHGLLPLPVAQLPLRRSQISAARPAVQQRIVRSLPGSSQNAVLVTSAAHDTKAEDGTTSALGRFEAALRFGHVLGAPIRAEDVYDRHAETASVWGALKPALEASSNAGDGLSVVWFGCVDGEALLPHKIASRYADFTVLAVHACQSAPDSLAFRANRDRAGGPRNLIVVDGPATEDAGADADDESPRAWRWAKAEDRPFGAKDGRCGLLVVSKQALGSLVTTQLPHEVEETLAEVLDWCSVAVLPKEQTSAFWATTDILVQNAKPAASTATKLWTPSLELCVVEANATADAARGAVSLRALGLLGVGNGESLRVVADALAATKSRDLSCALAMKAPLALRAGRLVALAPLDALAPCDADALAQRRQDYVRSLAEADGRDGSAYFVDGAAAGRRASSDSGASKATRAMLRMSHEESPAVARWASAARAALRGVGGEAVALVVGAELGMVALKAARFLRRGTVVAWRAQDANAHAELARAAGCFNVLTADGPASLEALRGLRAQFDVVLIGAARVANWLVGDGDDADCSARRLERRLGAALASATAEVLVELPRLQTLSDALEATAPQCAAEVRRAYLEHGVANASMAPEHQLLLNSLAFAQLDADVDVRLAAPGGWASVDAPLLFRCSWKRASASGASTSEGVSVAALLRVGVLPAVRAELFAAHLALPLGALPDHVEDVRSGAALSPWRLRYSAARRALILSYRGDGGSLVTMDSARNAEIDRGEVWAALRSEMGRTPADGRDGLFSFFLLGGNDDNASIAVDVALRFPNATIIAILGDDLQAADRLDAAADAADAENVLCCGGVAVDAGLLRKLYESPELARFALLQPRVVEVVRAGLNGDADWRHFVGYLMSSALTTFLRLPSAAHVSLAMHALFPTARNADGQRRRLRFADDLAYAPRRHPQPLYAGFAAALVAEAVLPAGGETEVAVRCPETLRGSAFASSLCRIDIVNMTRAVHHHFDWARDGHTRTYTMRIDVNRSATRAAAAAAGGLPLGGRADGTDDDISAESWRLVAGASLVARDAAPASGGGRVRVGNAGFDLAPGHHLSDGRVVHVRLGRDADAHYIPYGSIRSVTLIAALRLGLVKRQRERAFHAFVKLPLYEDMAPWNIAFAAEKVVYIDYDTRGATYDEGVAQAYRVLSVLMNYKRTVSDLGKCGPKAQTDYGFSHVSECVGTSAPMGVSKICADSALPVPCDDGQCHSDYVSCLRALSVKQEDTARRKAELDAQNSAAPARRQPSRVAFGHVPTPPPQARYQYTGYSGGYR